MHWQAVGPAPIDARGRVPRRIFLHLHPLACKSGEGPALPDCTWVLRSKSCVAVNVGASTGAADPGWTFDLIGVK